jgi:hypothetical protein
MMEIVMSPCDENIERKYISKKTRIELIAKVRLNIVKKSDNLSDAK